MAGSTVSSGWRLVARITAFTWIAWALVLTIAIGGLEPFVLIFAGVPIVAWALTLWRPSKVTYTIFGVLGLLVIALNLPFLAEDLAHPESAFGFNTSSAPLLASLLMVAVGIAAWRPLSDRSASRMWMTAAILFVIGLAVSLVAALGLEDDAAAAGDILIAAESAEWTQASLTASSGTVGILVENRDPVRHTFTVEQLDIDVELPAGTDRRVEFTAAAGTYAFHCSVPGHESMTGTIVVGG